jgi:hypothetical protein
MSNDCIEFELIPGVLELPRDDSRRVHVESCSRCSAFLASYQSFVKEEAAEGADPDDAHNRLTAFVASEIGPPPETAAGAKGPTRKGFLSRVTEGLGMRPAWAAAALVVVVAGVLWWAPWTPDETVLRGSKPADVLQPLVLSEPQNVSAGAVRLEWTPMSGADSYQVVLYDKDFNQVARLEPTKSTTLDIDRSMLSADTPSRLNWRVIALQRGDEIGASDPASFEF